MRCIGNPDLGLVVRIALASGARQAEIMNLRWRTRPPGSLVSRRTSMVIEMPQR
jgi:hypothetical protein